MPPKADFERAKELFPSIGMGEAEWVAVFHRNPDIMWAILGDIFVEVRAGEAREAGVYSTGRRPRQSASLAEVYQAIFPPAYSMDPFPAALRTLMRGRSQRAFAPRVPIDQGTLSRLLSGHLEPDQPLMERIAAAANVRPAYFLEWRAKMVSSLVELVLTRKPNMGVQAIRTMRQAWGEANG